MDESAHDAVQLANPPYGTPTASRERQHVLRICQRCNTLLSMKTLTVRLPETVVAEIEAESRRRKLSKSDVVRERLAGAEKPGRRSPALLEAIADVVGSVDRLPRDLSARSKKYL